MNESIIEIGSMTYAIKAKKCLQRAGIPAETVKTANSPLGCVYGVRIPYRATFDARAVLIRCGIEYHSAN